MTVDPNRILADLETIASFTDAPPTVGHSRPTFSTPWLAARDYVIAQAESAGCKSQVDPAGNVHLRPRDLPWHAKAWLSGSHIDSVPTGGKFDGVTGVVCPLEVLRAAHEDGRTHLPLELIVFAEEEGTTFGLGMIGSRLWTGDLHPGQIAAFRNATGQTYIDAGQDQGVNPDQIPAARIDPARYLGLIEIHVEQGLWMWSSRLALSLVTAIAGRRQYAIDVTGVANHAGSTRMEDRRDALAGAAEMILALESLAKDVGGSAVMTVGRIDARPNAINVIPGAISFTIDFRHGNDENLGQGDRRIRQVLEEIAQRRGLALDVRQTETQPPIPMDRRVVHALRTAGAAVGFEYLPSTVSGALHDAAILAPHLPTAMLFVASKDGISHNPAEFSRIEDIAAAARLLAEVVKSSELPALVAPDSTSPRKVTLQKLNTANRDEFIAVCGRLFENSPWVAEQAWPARPFESLDALHRTMCDVVHRAGADEQVSLIRAHPDLVGRLAREGQLTRESTREQSAAGLTALTEEEVTRFDRYNAEYREKFGFPFVICARENRKEAILAAFPKRLQNDRDAEIATALGEIAKISRLRLNDAVDDGPANQ